MMVTYFRKQPYSGYRSEWEARMLTAVQVHAFSDTKQIKYLEFRGIFTDFLHKQLGIESLLIEKCDCSTFL